MADNFNFTPGSGGIGAADDVGGVLYPRVKLDWGADGTANDVDTAAGKALPVQLRDTSGNEIATSAHPVRTDPTGTTTQPVSVASLPLPSGAALDSSVQALVSGTDFDSKVGSLTETAPTTDTASSGLNGRLQRIAQRLTSLITLLPTSLGVSGGLKVDGSGTALPVSSSTLALETGGNLATIAGAVSSSKVAVKAASGDLADGAIATIGAKADAKSTATDTTAVSAMSVWKQISASVQAIATSVAGTLTVGTHAVTQSGTWNMTQTGTWTVQPGNTANTTPWLMSQNPATSGGLSMATGSIGNTVTSVKASAGQVYGWYFYNSNSTVVYVQFFNTATGSVTLGTTAPVLSLGIPATSGANVEIGNGIAFSTAITIAVTTTRAGSTNTSNTVDYNILYK